MFSGHHVRTTATFFVAGIVHVSCTPSNPNVGDASVDVLSLGPVSFSRDVHPILTRECTGCHTGNTVRSDFRTVRSAYRELLAQGPAVTVDCNQPLAIVTPGNADQSGLYRLLRGWECDGDEYGMPRNNARGPLAAYNPQAAETIRRWIEEGALNN